MVRSRLNRICIAILIVFIILSPFFLNMWWVRGSPDHIFWAARILIGIDLIVVGLLFILVPQKFRSFWDWVNMGITYPDQDKLKPSLYVRISSFLTGVFCLYVGIRFLANVMSFFLQGCFDPGGCL